jgi:diaminopimelate decarboxylase (EC 4.1.1.20)
MLTPYLHYREDRLFLEETPLEQLAREFGTPAYVYSKAALLDNYQSYVAAFAASKPLICYAVKANASLAILALLARAGAGFDIVSGGELQRVLVAGGDPSKVIFSGVGKRIDEIDLALAHGIYSFNIESEAGIL